MDLLSISVKIYLNLNSYGQYAIDRSRPNYLRLELNEAGGQVNS